jgi:hypothetical protein
MAAEITKELREEKSAFLIWYKSKVLDTLKTYLILKSDF